MGHQEVVNTVPSVNLFLTSACNMRCKFCFAPSGHKQSLALCDAKCIIQDCHDVGIEKITFVGGEPLLYPHLYDVVQFAHYLGLTTCVVTNASQLSHHWLEHFSPVLDWVGMSVDSLSPKSNIDSGRSVHGSPVSPEKYLEMANAIKLYGMRLKINTTVSFWTSKDDLSEFIHHVRPDRWKIFQALQISEVNSGATGFGVSDEEFYDFVARHRGVSGYTDMVVETADDMTESYLMISPDGKLFDNIGGRYNYSPSIVEVGMREAMNKIIVDVDRFAKRGGLYEWCR